MHQQAKMLEANLENDKEINYMLAKIEKYKKRLEFRYSVLSPQKEAPLKQRSGSTPLSASSSIKEERSIKLSDGSIYTG